MLVCLFIGANPCSKICICGDTIEEITVRPKLVLYLQKRRWRHCFDGRLWFMFWMVPYRLHRLFEAAMPESAAIPMYMLYSSFLQLQPLISQGFLGSLVGLGRRV